jgi:GT2 family glycosyltransferase
MEVSFILVNYNTNALLLKAIAAIYQFTSPSLSFEVIVVDNASKENPADLLNQAFPQVILIHAPANNGFGAANNLAMPAAKGKYLFFLNPDAFLLSDAAHFFVQKMNDPAYSNMAFCSGELLNEQMQPNHCFGNFPSILGAISACGLKIFYPNYYRKHLSLGVANYDQSPKKVDYVSGAAFMVRAELVNLYGGFDPAFFLYFEETEWAYRLQQQGFYSMIFPAVKIIHIEGGSTEAGTNKVFNQRTFQLYAQSRQLFYKKTKGSVFAAIMKPLDLLQDLLRSIYHQEASIFLTKLAILWKA